MGPDDSLLEVVLCVKGYLEASLVSTYYMSDDKACFPPIKPKTSPHIARHLLGNRMTSGENIALSQAIGQPS